jgi:hypothetical protein
MTEGEYIAECHRGFARYGFTVPPLSVPELSYLFREGFSVEDAYGVACDVNADIPFDAAVQALCDVDRGWFDYAEEYER